MHPEQPWPDETRTTVIAPGWAAAATRTLTGARAWGGHWPWIGVVLVLIAAEFAAIEAVAVAWLRPVAVAVGVVLVWWAVRRAVRRSIEAELPVGSTIEIAYGTAGLTVTSPGGRETHPYEHYDRGAVAGPVAVFRVAATKQPSLVPSELVPQAIVDRYRSTSGR